MALEAVVYPQDPFSYACKDLYSLGAAEWDYEDFCFHEGHKPLHGAFDQNENGEQGVGANWDSSSSPSMMQQTMESGPNSSSPEARTAEKSLSRRLFAPMEPQPTTTMGGRRKRRRTKSVKNKEEIENQRMTHIAVERNRRKQMNEYLAVLRSLMPPSYVQKGDQASIIGGSINFVKELEQLLQSMESKKRSAKQPGDNGAPSPFADFFTLPQYSSRATQRSNSFGMTTDSNITDNIADIEVTLVEIHAHVKILTKRQPRQLLKMVASFQSLRLSILHLNVTTTVDGMVLYSFSLKAEEGCQLSTVDAIAGAVNQTLLKIEEEAAAFI